MHHQSPGSNILGSRGGGTKVKRLLTMDGELRGFDEDSASADQFIFYNKKPYSLKWNPKALNTFPVTGPSSLGELRGVKFLGTLRPLYAQEVQRLALTDLSRIGLAVAPIMGVDATATVHIRVKADKGTLDPEDGKKLAEFLREKNEEQLLSGFLIKGAVTKDKGPLSTTIKIAAKPDQSKTAAWRQFSLSLSDEAMEELLSVDPSVVVEATEQPVAAGDVVAAVA